MKNVLYLIATLFATGVALVMTDAVRKIYRHERLTADWPRVQATVTGSRAGWSTGFGNMTPSRRFWPTYRFTDTQGREFTAESEVSFAGRPVPGSVVEVAYDPVNPIDSFQVSRQDRTTLGCLILFFAVFVPVLFWFIGIFPL